jgi:hypothetical protein
MDPIRLAEAYPELKSLYPSGLLASEQESYNCGLSIPNSNTTLTMIGCE